MLRIHGVTVIIGPGIIKGIIGIIRSLGEVRALRNN